MHHFVLRRPPCCSCCDHDQPQAASASSSHLLLPSSTTSASTSPRKICPSLEPPRLAWQGRQTLVGSGCVGARFAGRARIRLINCSVRVFRLLSLSSSIPIMESLLRGPWYKQYPIHGASTTPFVQYLGQMLILPTPPHSSRRNNKKQRHGSANLKEKMEFHLSDAARPPVSILPSQSLGRRGHTAMSNSPVFVCSFSEVVASREKETSKSLF